ncbi:alkaline phosphatase D family protein [Georgenia subflava]|uniref:Alkaline phosphatase family protein n=1 Tax=Georgenia subflava TaxID=1622177 RepID=A0A6N7EJY2_9MICO|nr:alkaline phosphatase D family protein [Georgenia subflava]MPV37373.1 alkaline phosphatase family protein [Georgenia subflava]
MDPVRGTEAPRLLLGPLLRHVDATSATVWVETDRPCDVVLRAGGRSERERTWAVHGHHYALVALTGLEPASEHPYEVLLDDRSVWPEPESRFPPSVIRTIRPDASLRLAFGSCRRCAPDDDRARRAFGVDALAGMAERMAVTAHEEWPDALFLAGDQIYADDPSPELVERLKAAHVDGDRAVRAEVQNFEEYTWLYHESWTPPPVRWLLSTVPSAMILDDHDLRDDWNSSLSWREWATAQDWWRGRVTGAFASYWIYQHLGNLSPDELEQDRMWALVRGTTDDAARTDALDAFAWRSDAEPTSVRWSFYRDFGTPDHRIRLVVVDSRCSRRLGPDERSMVDDDEWQWVLDHARAGNLDHLLIGTTLPFLLPHGIHHLEGWNEAVTSRRTWRPVVARFGEVLRRAVDLEHWAAFRGSFDSMVDLLEDVIRGADPPASVLVLSGDVHCSYTARAELRTDHPATAVHQLTQSPFRNPMETPLRLAYAALDVAPVRLLWHKMARSARVTEVPLRWDVDHGPWFVNGVMTLVISGRDARVDVDGATVRAGRPWLSPTASIPLTTATPSGRAGFADERAAV